MVRKSTTPMSETSNIVETTLGIHEAQVGESMTEREQPDLEFEIFAAALLKSLDKQQRGTEEVLVQVSRGLLEMQKEVEELKKSRTERNMTEAIDDLDG